MTVCSLLHLLVGLAQVQAADRATAVNRVGSDIRYLASDELEGRGPGTAGLEKAAQYIRTSFEQLGLRGAGNDGAYTRPFDIKLGSKSIASKTFLKLLGPDGQEFELQLGEQFQPLASQVDTPLELDLVFVGYGISAPKLEYDDYQDADLAGKAFVVIRREPQQDNEESVFDGKRASRHATIRMKLQAAEKSGAAALLLVNDPFTVRNEKTDALSQPGGFGRTRVKFPFLHVKQEIVDQILDSTPVRRAGQTLTSVAEIEADIDENLQPMTQPLEGWKARLRCVFETQQAEVTNVAAVLEGEGPFADQTIVIGAHYDHLGFGPYGSRRRNSREVHNGADDNATGTAAVLELARRYAARSEKPARRLVFVAFTGEERGLLGSNYYLQHPLFPLDQTVAMVNFDMIGHLGENGLTVGGVQSAPEFATMINQASESGAFEVATPSNAGGSDHSGFYRNNIPFMFFHTGITDIYHTPDDDFETIDVKGAVAAIDFAERVVDQLLSMPERPTFTKIQRTPRVRRATAYLGIVPAYGEDLEKGVKCTQVNPGSPAAKGDMQPDDLILKIGEVDVPDMSGLTAALRQYKAGDKVQIVVRRGDATKTLDVTLGSPGQ
jgi:hypothetical protein